MYCTAQNEVTVHPASVYCELRLFFIRCLFCLFVTSPVQGSGVKYFIAVSPFFRSQAFEREGTAVCVPVIPSCEYCVETVNVIYASLSPFSSSFNLYRGMNAFFFFFLCPNMDI